MATVKIYPLANNQMKYLQASKLFSIDSFSSWISTISATTISSVQYIKNDLEISINLDLSQTYAQPKQTIHYVSIQNAGEDTYYYYVKNTVWRSKSTVRLELVMDVLNTFKDGTDYTFKENTRITREHKDRFTVTTREIQFRWHITQQIGYLDVGDTVIIINDHGDTVFTGKIDSIDSYNCSIIITSNESADEIRQHLNDFIADPYEINKNGSNYYFFTLDTVNDWTLSYTKFRNIDIVPENINPLLQCGDTDGQIIEHNKTLLQTDWYLLYRNQNNPTPDSLVNPVECYLIPNQETKTAYGYISGGRLIPSYLMDNYYYLY